MTNTNTNIQAAMAVSDYIGYRMDRAQQNYELSSRFDTLREDVFDAHYDAGITANDYLYFCDNDTDVINTFKDAIKCAKNLRNMYKKSGLINDYRYYAVYASDMRKYLVRFENACEYGF